MDPLNCCKETLFWWDEDLKRDDPPADLVRRMPAAAGPAGAVMTIDGRSVINFAANDYLGLASHPRIKQAVVEALDEEGVGAGASRLISGDLAWHRRLETALAHFKRTESALLFSSGYMANCGVISALCGPGDVVFSDRLNHASLIDGMRLSGARFRRYPHRDVSVLKRWLQRTRARRVLIATDSVFSMDGDVAPLKELTDLARRHHAWLLIDEAHATGVLGPTGSGAYEAVGLAPEPFVIQMGTLSKALGCFGAYVAGSSRLRQALIQRARTVIYTTAMPPAWAAAAYEALRVIQEQPQRRQRLINLSRRVRQRLRALGLTVWGHDDIPIIPVITGSSEEALRWSQRLWQEGVYCPAIRPPTVPAGTARLRISLSAAHTDDQIERLIRCFETLTKSQEATEG